LWKAFSSVRMTVFLLILLAGTSVLGTVILQKGTPHQYLVEYGPGLARILDFFGLFDMYHSWWFLAILGLLVVNLLFCSLKRLPSVWRQVFHPRIELAPSRIEAQPFTAAFRAPEGEEGLAEKIGKEIHRFFRNPKRIEGREGLILYFEKGRYGRLGVYVAHLSVIIILAGGMIGSVFGFSGVLKILEGETKESILLRRKGGFVDYPLGYQVRCEDFEISYYDIPGPRKFVSEYTSVLSILENGREVRRVKVRVNHPMAYKGLKFYQSSYGSETEAVLRIRRREADGSHEIRIHEGQRVSLPGNDLSFQLLGYFPQVHNFGPGIQLALFPRGGTPRRIWLFKKIPDYDEKRGGDFVFTLDDVLMKQYTVLQVNRQPGVWVVWVGSGLLIVGTIMAFFIPHRRLWILISGEKGAGRRVLLGGTSHRNRVGFEREFSDLLQRLEGIGLKPIRSASP